MEPTLAYRELNTIVCRLGGPESIGIFRSADSVGDDGAVSAGLFGIHQAAVGLVD